MTSYPCSPTAYIARGIALLAIAWPLAVAAQDPFGDMGEQQNPFGSADPFSTGEPETAEGSPFGPPATGASESPFGNLGTAPRQPTAPATDAAPDTTARDTDPVVRLLRESPPTTPKGLANGLTWMARLKRWDQVRWLLDRLDAADWPLEEQAELARAGGAGLWLRIRSDDAGLSDSQRAVVRAVLSAPSKLARDAAWIDSWIDKLASSSAGERRLAQLRLQDGSMEAVKRLIDRLLDGDTSVQPALLASTVAGFGRDGADALRTACLVRDRERAARVYMALAELPGKEFTAELGTGLVSTHLAAEDREALAEILRERYSTLPSLEAIHRHVVNRFEYHLAQYQDGRGGLTELTDFVWRLTPDRNSIEKVEATKSERLLEQVSRLAALRMQLPVELMEEAVDSGAIMAQRAYKVSPALSGGERGQHFFVPVPQHFATQSAYWIRVFERATELQMHGGAVRALQMLVESAPGNYEIPIDYLSELLDDPRPVIRYATLAAIAEADPREKYAGAEQAVEVALEMTQLSRGPHTLIVGLQSELRQAAAQQVQLQTGGEVTSLNSARGALLAIEGEQPIELVMIVDRVADQSLFEFLQRLRKSRGAGALPIAVLTDELYAHERQWVAETGGVVKSVLSRNPEQMQRIVSRMLDSLDITPMTAGDRIDFQVTAGAFLAQVAGDRDRYHFYPIADWQERLVALRRTLPPLSQARLLSGLGNGASQVQLTNLAADSRLSEQERLTAAQAFGQSVRRFGLNLRRDEVLKMYDLYNALGPKDPMAVQSLGLTLDVIEAHAGKKEWPEGL